jgi:hypothetical protein
MPAVPSEVLLLLMETLEQSDYDAVFPAAEPGGCIRRSSPRGVSTA